eukprot:3650336-Amphidinium_carterae.1
MPLAMGSDSKFIRHCSSLLCKGTSRHPSRLLHASAPNELGAAPSSLLKLDTSEPRRRIPMNKQNVRASAVEQGLSGCIRQ